MSAFADKPVPNIAELREWTNQPINSKLDEGYTVQKMGKESMRRVRGRPNWLTSYIYNKADSYDVSHMSLATPSCAHLLNPLLSDIYLFMHIL